MLFFFHYDIKVPLVWVMKGSYFGFGSPQQQVDMHARSKKTLSFSYNMHLFLPYLLNDSQTIRSTMNFSKPLLRVTLICGDWSDWSILFKAVFVSAVLHCVKPLLVKQLFLTLQKWHLVAKHEFAFSFRPTRKSSFPMYARATSGRAIC